MVLLLAPTGRRLVGVLALVLAACASGPPSGDDSAGSPLRGIDFAGDREDAADPDTILGSVTITNRRSTPATIEVPDPCVALLRAYEPDGERLAPVWDQGSLVECDGEPATIVLEPGERRRVEVPPVSASAILGDSLPPGRYRLTAYVRPGGRVVEVEIGEADLDPPR